MSLTPTRDDLRAGGHVGLDGRAGTAGVSATRTLLATDGRPSSLLEVRHGVIVEAEENDQGLFYALLRDGYNR